MKKPPAPSPERLRVLEKIEEYERLGGDYFFCDVENDPPHTTLMLEDVDYLYETPARKWGRMCATTIRTLFGKSITKGKFHLTVEGEEHLKGLTGGAVFTSNHFGPFENLCVREAAKHAPGKHRFFCVIREGNYAIPGFLGFLLKNCDTLPLSSSAHTMAHFNRAVKQYLKEGCHVLIYPEQAMWYRYKKPRPYRIGAFHIAAKNGVPVVPCFVTFLEHNDLDSDGFPRLTYTIHIMPPIWPDKEKSPKENAAWMLERNAALTRQKYEEIYGIPLTYTTTPKPGDDAL